MDNTQRILNKLDSISDDVTEIKTDLAYMKAKAENHGEKLVGIEMRISKLEESQTKDRVTLAKLKTNSAKIGAGAGGIVAIVTAILNFFFR